MFEVVFYETEDGKKVFEDWLDSLEPKMNAKMTDMLLLLQEKGNQLRKPYTDDLKDGIYELRASHGSNISCALFFFYMGRKIVVTNGFIKKQQKTPRNEIVLAKKRREDYIRQQEKKKEGDDQE